MKKALNMLLALMLCLGLVSCAKETSDGHENNHDSSVEQNGNDSVDDSSRSNGNEDPVVLDVEYVVGTWVLIEEQSSGLTDMKKFELYEDGTGIISESIEEKSNPTSIKWMIDMSQFNGILHIVKVDKQSGVYLELHEAGLADLTWSDLFERIKG